MTDNQTERFIALDVFRGFTITAMILVNNPGSWSHIYEPLKHADWHGWTITDLVFPFFLFIVGVAISLSKNGLKNQSGALIKSAAIRSLKLLALGWFLALFYYNFSDPDFNWLQQKLFDIRIMGVLQRIAVVYFFTLLLFLFFKPLSLFYWFVVLTLSYGLLLLYLPYSGQDGEVFQGLLLKGNNLSAWLDHLLIGSNHVYSQTVPFTSDPEGLLSTIPAIATCLTGVLCGLYLQSAKKHGISTTKQVTIVSLVGIICFLLGELINNVIPINKPLWTPSYVLMSTGLACLAFAFFIYLIDVLKWKKWSFPFIVFGENAIAFYMFSGILARLLIMIPVADSHLKNWLYQTLYAPTFGNITGSLMFALSILLVSYLVMLWMYRNKFFWKV